MGQPSAPTQFNADENIRNVHNFCREMLVGTSRTFALSIPELPSPLDDWVQCAYLICRMIDTLEDRPLTEEADRQASFDEFLATLGPPLNVNAARQAAMRFASLAGAGPTADPCVKLMTHGDLVLQTLATFPPAAIDAIRRAASEMAIGLRETPLPPKHAQPTHLFNTVRQLERYCHYAAGVVGQMLTRLFRVHLGHDPNDIDRRTMHHAKRFGRGLQLTNILKDHPSDLTDGRCFMPTNLAARCNVKTAELLQSSLPMPVRIYVARRAAAHLDAALEYCLSLPSDPTGIRLFCVQPMMMALLTLERSITHLDVTPDDRPKITREQVRDVITTSRREAGDDARLRDWYHRLRSDLSTVVNNALTGWDH